MLYNRYYNLKSTQDFKKVFTEIDFFFIGNSNEIRAKNVMSLASEYYKGEVLSINYDIEFEKYSIQKITSSNLYRKEDLHLTGKDLVMDFMDDLKNLDINNKNILIDITSLKHPFLFYFLLLLKKDFHPKSLFITYTEPEKYVQEEKDENIIKKFDLTEKFCSVNSLPGFARISDHNKERILIALMGFEGNRFSKAFEDVNPSDRKTCAIVGFPSFQPSWQYYVYSQNQYALDQSKAFSSIKRSTANEPFGVYNILQDIKNKNEDFELVVAPLGTKPHSLGACMFAIDNEDIQIYYDFPSFGSKTRTIGIGSSFLYNLTDFVNRKGNL
jgi:hypothetical protein